MQKNSRAQEILKIGSFNARRGGISTIPVTNVEKYCWHLSRQQNNPEINQEIKLIPSVSRFQQEINNDPMLRMNFNDQILGQLPMRVNKDGISFRLLGDTVKEAMLRIHIAATSPPRYENSEITAVAIYAVFFDFIQSPLGQNFLANRKVNSCLKQIFEEYSKGVLCSSISLSTIDDWIYGNGAKQWNPDQYDIDQKKPYMGFTCWNDFFLRKFKKGVRPVAEPQNQDVIIMACESLPIADPHQPTYNIKQKDFFWMKDQKYSLFDMVDAINRGNEGIMRDFVGGTIYQAFLNLFSYHHWHCPVDGVIEDFYTIQGCYFLKSPHIEDSFDSFLYSQPFLSCVSTRQVFLIKSDNQKIGRIIVIMIGLSEVSSCVVEPQIKIGSRVKKGQTIGHFEFGGSSHCIIFERKCKPKFNEAIENSYFYDEEKKMESSNLLQVNSELARVE